MEYFLIIVLLLAVAAITFHAAGLEPSRVVKKWLVRLANGQSIPEKPDLSWWLTWLLPLHYEARAVFQRMNAMREENRLLRERIGEFEYLQYYILGSLMEGVLVVNDKLEITMINAEFLNIYQLQQSPLKQTL
ncbi:MAG: hypothetical protein M0Q93_05360, partial [Terrimicrobiaceae bacterium]|nr:hypothetical protein [Terrimicrobiaceae bacterium]